MDHPGLVRGLQRLRNLLGNGQRLIQRDRPFGDPVGEGRAFHQLQDQRLGVFALLDAVDLRNVRVVQAGEHLRFPLEPGEPIRVSGEGVGQDLQRDVTAQLGVGGAIDLAHPAFADEGGHVVMAEATTWTQGHQLADFQLVTTRVEERTDHRRIDSPAPVPTDQRPRTSRARASPADPRATSHSAD